MVLICQIVSALQMKKGRAYRIDSLAFFSTNIGITVHVRGAQKINLPGDSRRVFLFPSIPSLSNFYIHFAAVWFR